MPDHMRTLFMLALAAGAAGFLGGCGKATIGNGSSNVPSEGTLTVDPAKPDGSQVFHRVVDPDRSSTDTTFLFKPDGIFLKATSTQPSLTASILRR